MNRIIVAVDRSETSQQAFKEAIALAQALSGQLMLVHVLSPMEESYPNAIFPIDSVYTPLKSEAIKAHFQQWEALEKDGLTLLNALTAQATTAGIATEFSQALGNPGQTICTLARTWKADLIVIGRRGRAGLTELFLGSVSNYVLHHAPCSVLTVQGIPKT
ncbi:universal stress protein [Desertifilum sp. FACHB-1129]|uniref:Universal stress protein UspA n=2 Tax=Desertifilum tharense IPPAS B-1220 TaxID=1781255 RepID=A0A1E5QDL7_9CYAN|nr:MULTISPECIES: universal stress protein [Desertifilum]MDA0211655.1 universal stress protein [Cyanobacteria bacterium FC1]MBD2312162.1 universal stress protein [Desertifilum sp. FACHB-1129]MBD2322176.1 universal stress protein [Desertifilum sp. FACHB-866]MBD2332213.1 universal stress protein [Desertifilum sp. FACHB-868]OEJ72423.1 universal stress protein UspA [Desertifilum tharense IPPAS B-1220]